MMNAEQNEEMWRRRLVQCGPITLVDTMMDNPVPEVRQWAGEQLDKQLLARGFKPNRH